MKTLQKKLLRDVQGLKSLVMTLAILVICGVSVLVSSWSAYESLEKARREYYEQYNFADVFVDFERAPSEVLDRLKKIPGIERIEGRIVEDVLLDLKNQMEPAVGRFISWRPEGELNKIYLRKGRWPEKGMVPQVIVHESFAKAHGLNVGSRVVGFFKGEKTVFEISGVGISPEYVYALNPASMLPDDLHFGVFWMRHEVLEQLAQKQGAFNNIIAQLGVGASLDLIKLEIDQVMSSFGSLGSYDRKKQISNMFVQDEIRQQKSMAAIIPSIFVAVGAFILNVVVSRLVTLHRGQISILKALGYTSFQLAFYYWKLITLILIFGILPSFIFAEGIGRWYATLYERYFRFPKIDFSITSEAVLLGVVIGLLPGWISSMRSLARVFSLSPSEGMRPPSPPYFHKTLLEKFGFFRQRAVTERMVLRDLFFHPIRTLAAIMGIAAATAIMVNGTFWMDIVSFMIQRQFQEMSREDLEVRLVYARKMDALNELLRIPGVLFVEGVRTVPVRMKMKNLVKETALIALEDDSSLRRILNREGKVLRPPQQGVLLSSYFQKKYKIQVGEVLDFQVMQGQQNRIRLPVMGFVDDVVGSSVYIDKSELHRWLQEEPVIDAIYLKIDPAYREQIYVNLKEHPLVAAVTVKKLLLQSFRKTTAEMILVFTMILVAFAIAISGAVLFNVSRISLSEKSWELASLRIIGFQISPVFQILFLQIGVQVLIALIPGLFLGYGLSFLSTYWIHSETFIFPLVVEAQTYALATFITLMVYLVSGSFLFRQIELLNLTEALKSRE